MKTISSLADWDDDEKHCAAAIDGAARTVVIRDNLDAILSRFEVYRIYRASAEKIPASVFAATSWKNDFIALYKRPPKGMKELKQRLRNLELEYCSYCGGDNPPSQLDHILEKAKFPEFSLLSLNLVHVCVTCNNSKTDPFRNGVRCFLNPYVDTFMDHIDVTCCIRIVKGWPSFEILLSGNISAADRDIAIRHLDTFKISTRFPDWARRKFKRLSKSYSLEIAGGLDAKAWVEKRGNDHANDHHRNSWVAVLCRGIAASDEALELFATYTIVSEMRKADQ